MDCTYPDETSADKYLAYYGKITNNEVVFDNLPDYIKIRTSKKESLAIISDNNEQLLKILSIFPLGYYRLVYWITPSRTTKYSENFPAECNVDTIDRVLCVCNS